MYIQQLYTACLSEAAYYIESDGEAAIIDPLRDTDDYLQLAASRNARIKYVFETHFHADFVSGHLDLGRQTGAPIVFGPGTKTRYPVVVAKDGESFALGNITLTTLHTPGHTLESTCWLLNDETGKPHALFSGDTLFIGDVGRPDLSSGDVSGEVLASMMYDSLQHKILPLPDEVMVYPAHGSGSENGMPMDTETFSTLGKEKQHNFALQPQTREAFVAAVTQGLAEAPRYFAINAQINQQGYGPFSSLMEKALQPLDLPTFRELTQAKDAIILDTRTGAAFAHGFIPGSIQIGLDGRFAEWAGNLLPFDQSIVLVTEPGREAESITRLARVGFEKIQGYLQGGYETWAAAGNPQDMLIEVEADELAMDLPFDDNLMVVDVRTETEYASGHVVSAHNLPLNEMTDLVKLALLPPEANLYVHCADNYRATIACSLLKRQGMHNLRYVTGGWNAIKEESRIPVEKDKKVLN